MNRVCERVSVLAIVCVLAWGPTLAHAASVQTRVIRSVGVVGQGTRLSGSVQDRTGRPVDNVRVTLKAVSTGSGPRQLIYRQIVTKHGRFVFGGLQAGRYEVTVREGQTGFSESRTVDVPGSAEELSWTIPGLPIKNSGRTIQGTRVIRVHR